MSLLKETRGSTETVYHVRCGDYDVPRVTETSLPHSPKTPTSAVDEGANKDPSTVYDGNTHLHPHHVRLRPPTKPSSLIDPFVN